MKLVMTMMVRDEIDIVAAMIEHHLAQGVDLMIITDNGSVDGTRELLAEYADSGRIELHDYLEHDKRQFEVVTRMARRAYTEHHADWVINADADEFFIPVDRQLTLKQAFENIPSSLGSFRVPVTNMTGYPAKIGSGLRRLRWRDVRSEAALMATAGLHAHPTPDAIHIGSADVEVVQGNHSVNIPSSGEPDPAYAIEVLHYPWRSWQQYSTKVENSGVAYLNSPTLRPSPRHHGMRDFRHLRAGALEHFYVYRHPNVAGPDGVDPEQFVEDDSLITELEALAASGGAIHPDRLTALLSDDGDQDSYPPQLWPKAGEIVGYIIPLEAERAESLTKALAERNAAHAEVKALRAKVAELKRQLKAAAPQQSVLQKKVKGVRRRLGRIRRRILGK